MRNEPMLNSARTIGTASPGLLKTKMKNLTKVSAWGSSSMLKKQKITARKTNINSSGKSRNATVVFNDNKTVQYQQASKGELMHFGIQQNSIDNVTIGDQLLNL